MFLSAVPRRACRRVFYLALLGFSFAALSLPAARRAYAAPAPAPRQQNFLSRAAPLVKIDFTASPLQQMLGKAAANSAKRPPINGIDWLNAAPAAADGSFMCGQLAASVFAPTEVYAEAEIAEAVVRFYQNRPQFLWLNANGKLRPQARQLMQAMAQAEQDGLNPADYSLPALPAAAANDEKTPNSAEQAATAAQFELCFSARLLRYVSDLCRGRVPPAAFKQNYDLPPKPLDFSTILAQLSSAEAPQERLAAMRPHSEAYRALQAGLADLTAKSAAQANAEANAAAPAAAAHAAKQRQAIEYSLERLRWLPPRFPRAYILVNIPAFSAQFFADNREVLNMRAVVGAKHSPTAIFTSQVERVVFNPSWGVPYSIMKNEMAAKIAKDPSYPARHNYEIYRNGRKISPAAVNWAQAVKTGNIHIRQKPGAGNALGKLKILFPNAHNIYMHDTPAQSAFARENRALSHGCVRLAQPEAMAAAVLGKEETKLAPYFKRAENGIVPPQGIGVYLAYFTAWPQADQRGQIRYYADIYGLDASLYAAEAALSKARAAGNARSQLPPSAALPPLQAQLSPPQAQDNAANADNMAALPPNKPHGG